MQTKAVIHVSPGKGAQVIGDFREYLNTKEVATEQITSVCIDLSPSFISGIEEHFPQANITFDRFHVKALLNKAMDEVRKSERTRHQSLKGHKYTFLKASTSLTGAQAIQRNMLLEAYPQLGEAYRRRELFDDFWSMQNSEQAQGFLAFWCDLAREAAIPPFIKFANTVQKHFQGILNYLNSRLTNGILEGINSKIQLAKRRVRGYRNITNFINMIYFICGKLKFDYPHYST